MLDFDDPELAFVIKSLSISYDATSRRIDRLTGRHRSEALDEIDVCNTAMNKAKAEQARRRRSGDPIYPIGVDR